MHITGIYQRRGQAINLGAIPVLGALGCTKQEANGIPLYILHTEATSNSCFQYVTSHDESCLLFYVKATDPVITASQLDSIKQQIRDLKQDLFVGGVTTAEEGEALEVVESKKMQLPSPRPADEVLFILAPTR